MSEKKLSTDNIGMAMLIFDKGQMNWEMKAWIILPKFDHFQDH